MFKDMSREERKDVFKKRDMSQEVLSSLVRHKYGEWARTSLPMAFYSIKTPFIKNLLQP